MPDRQLWMDNLRVVVIAGVVAAHAGMGYVFPTGWYYEEEGDPSPAASLLAAPLFVGWLFGLGMLFFVAGLLAPESLARRGAGAFARGRLLRLGVPAAAFFLLLAPLSELIGHGWREGIALLATPEGWGFGPAWFVVTLLLADLLYAVWRGAGRRLSGDGAARARVPLLLVLAVAAASFVVRLRWPLASATPLDLGFTIWPQSFGMYAFGAWLGERGGLDAVPRRWIAWARGGAVAAAGAAVGLFAWAFAGASPETFAGGARWQPAAVALVEAALVVSTTLWVTRWLRARWSAQGSLMRHAARASYAAYLLHAPALTAVMVGLAAWAAPPEAKVLAATALGVPATFAAGWLATRPRVLARVV